MQRGKRLMGLLIMLLIHGAVCGQFPNVVIDDKGRPEEPSICLDPKHPNRMVAGANIRYAYYSSDTGRTWHKQALKSQWKVAGDPCIIVDTSGVFYYFSLSNAESWLDRMICKRSMDGGQSWPEESFIGFNVLKDQDKEWAAVDPATNTLYLTWTQFDKYASKEPFDSTHILFARSEDGGKTWTEPLRINDRGGDCLDDDNTVEGAVPAIGPKGEVYVAWAGPAGIRLDCSMDQGKTWMSHDILVDSQPGGWSYDIPGIYRCNGLPVTLCDHSRGHYRGRVYVHWSDQRNGVEDTDIWLARSDDGGMKWSTPVRVNTDTTASHQFMSWMTIDQTTGYLWSVFYDRRNHPGNDSTDVYLAWSTDGGAHFKDVKISERPFLPRKHVFFGDYINIVAHDGIVRPVWTAMKGRRLRVLTALVDGHRLTQAP